jgi:hypothetical protein
MLRLWDKREEYASSRHKTSAEKLSSEKFKGKYPESSRRTPAKTSGNERTRISAAYSATASGIKLPIHILVNRATEIPNYEHPENSKIFSTLVKY